jgi:hypothetical protein
MFEYFEAEKAKKKALTSAEKKELKRVRDEEEAKYLTCLLDGRKEKVGNFKVEPPGLFRGRGEHPKKGSLKVYTPTQSKTELDRYFLPSIAFDLRTSPSTSVKMRPFLSQTCPETGRKLFTTTPSPGLPLGRRT